MKSRVWFAIVGMFVTAGSDVVINLLTAGIQQRAFPGQFSDQALWILAALAIAGSAVGYWLGGQLQVPASSSPQNVPADITKSEVITISRLRALLSYSKLKGKGIHLSNILLIGSRIDIEA